MNLTAIAELLARVGLMIAAYIDQIIMILTGAWASAVAYGAMPPPFPDVHLWESRFRPMFRVIGPLLLVIGLVLAVAQMMGNR
jgi:hypothetical protein